MLTVTRGTSAGLVGLLSSKPSPSKTASKTAPASAAQMCDECDRKAAAFECLPCGQLMCIVCDTSIHARGKRAAHERVAVAPPAGPAPPCEECEKQESTQNCQECGQMLCSDCDKTLHAKGLRAKHARTPVSASSTAASVSTRLDTNAKAREQRDVDVRASLTNIMLDSKKSATQRNVWEPEITGRVLHRYFVAKALHREQAAAPKRRKDKRSPIVKVGVALKSFLIGTPGNTLAPEATMEKMAASICQLQKASAGDITQPFPWSPEAFISFAEKWQVGRITRKPSKRNTLRAVLARKGVVTALMETKLPAPEVCCVCEVATATISCKKCQAFYCTPCNQQAHKVPVLARKHHDYTAYPATVAVFTTPPASPPSDSVSGHKRKAAPPVDPDTTPDTIQVPFHSSFLF